MPLSRRVFLAGSLTGAGALVLTACTQPAPAPSTSATPTRTPTPTPTATSASGASPSAFRRSSWGTDPYAYGSTSLLTDESTDSDRQRLAAPIDDKLFFAGEAVAASYPGTLAGARLSGLAAAGQVAAVAADGERIAVIGAGIAGATAARDLADRGFDVVVVEARHRVGGRIASTDSADWPIDAQLGAGLLSGSGTQELDALLTEGGVTLVPFAAKTTARNGTRSTPFPATATTLGVLSAADTWADGRSREYSVETAVTGSRAAAKLSATADGSGVSDAERLAFLLDDALPVRFGAEPDTISARLLGASPTPRSGQLATKGLVEYIAALLKDLDVLRGSNVTQIDYGNQGVGLRLVTGESLSADRVVSTIPLGVLKAKKIVFSPELPVARLDAMDRLGVGVQDVLWLRFDEKLWSTDATVWAVLDATATYRLWLNLEPATGYPILVGLIGGDAAVAAEKLSDSDAVAAAMTDIAAYLDLVPVTASPTPSPSPTP